MAFELPKLPWAKDALSPHMSAETLEYHHGKHHKAYLDKMNAAIQGTDKEKLSLEELVRSAEGPLFNNAAQTWNHSFFWNCLSPQGGGAPSGAIADAIQKSFGGYDNFRRDFTDAATTLFGSGWTWLVQDAGALKIVKTTNAETPLTSSAKPLLTLDVWEHAYYVDYRNARPKFIDAFLDHLVNWDFANQNLTK
jgi:Fe-Mn family superoxide dismutase